MWVAAGQRAVLAWCPAPSVGVGSLGAAAGAAAAGAAAAVAAAAARPSTVAHASRGRPRLPGGILHQRGVTTMAASGLPKIDAYALGTPNGKKLTIALEELGLPYTFHKVTFDHVKDPWFTKISPNGKIPAIAINAPAEGEDGTPELTLMESGAIMAYLGKLAGGKLMGGADPVAEAKVNQWLFWVNAGVGPMLGQVGHFKNLADGHPAKEYGTTRYTAEGARLLSVLETQLAATGAYMAGPDLSMADLAGWPWISAALSMGMADASAYPAVSKWVDRVGEREGVKRGLAVFA